MSRLILLRSGIRRVDDVFTVRQRAREVAAGLRFERQDQVRIATAVSEVARELVARGPESTAEFLLDENVLAITFTGAGIAGMDKAPALTAAGRLVDSARLVADREGTFIVLTKALPARAHPAARDIARLQKELTAAQPPDALDDLRAQNREMADTLDQLKQKQEELLQLNAELQVTNEGVMAMHAALQEELEVTNQGVVALYAELDERSQQLKEASEAKTRFLRSISHELRAPVNAILGLAGLLRDDGEPGAPDRSHQIELIFRSAKDLLVLVDDLLDLAKAEAGRIVPVVSSVDLVDLLRQLDATLRPLLSPEVEMELVIGEDIPHIETDEVLFGRMVRNLMSNAIKFTAEGSITTRLTAKASSQHVEISVTDTGVGIPEPELERIFEEFYQVKGPHQTGRKGTGLGLPYVRKVAEGLGGRVAVASTPGVGSTFTLRLPVRWSAAPATQTEEVRGAGFPLVERVLVADDDESFRLVLRGMLQGLAVQIKEAVDGADALQMMRSEVPDLLFLDLKMPGVDGAGVIGSMMSDPELREVPVVIVSSAPLDDTAASAGLGFASALISKSNLTRELVGHVVSEVMGDSTL